MTQTSRLAEASLSGRQRLFAALLVIGLLAPWILASILEPDSRGHGTHQQLGLWPCTFRVLFDRRCPTCGMTTAWAHLARGQLVPALRANVGGTVLGLLELAAGAWLLLSSAWGRWLGWVPNSTALACAAAAVVLITLVDWGFRLLLTG